VAGSKLSALSALTDVTLSDLMHLLDASETVDASKNKQVTLGTLLHALRLVSAIGTVDTAADKLLAVDADGSVVGTIVINTLQLTASQIASGTLVDARVAASNVTQHQTAISITESQISDFGSYLTDITGEALSTLADVTITSIASGEVLTWNGSAWVNNTLAEAGVAAVGHNHAASDITSGTLAHERGGIESDISGVLIGDVLAGTGSGAIGIVAASGKSAGDVLTIQADGSADWETPAGGGGGGGGGGGLSNVVDDTSPQLGGNLDVNLYSIVSAGGNDITITPDTSGSIVLDGLSWPQSDGTSGQALITDGSGQLSWSTISGAGETNTASNVGASGVGVFSAKVSADLQFNKVAAGTGLSVSLASNVITISQTALTASRAVVTDGSGNYAVSDVTATELGYLDGVTSAIQTQIDGKSATTHTHTLNDLSDVSVASPTAGHVLTWNGTAWVAQAASGGASALGDLSDVQDSLTGSQGDVLYYDGTHWTSLAAGGTDGHVLTADGMGGIAWEAAASGLADVVADTTPQLGGMLDVNGFSIGNGTEELIKFVETASAVNEITITNAASGVGAPTIAATGTDSTIALYLQAKGGGDLIISNGSTTPTVEIDGAVSAFLRNPSGQLVIGGTKILLQNQTQIVSRIYQLFATLTDGATVTLDWSTGNQGIVTLGGNRTLAFTNLQTGQRYTLWVKQDGTGGRTLTWPSYMIWDGGTAPTLATTGGHYDCFVFTCLDHTVSAEIVHGALAASDAS
jgi:hypothetical protein